MVLSPEHMDLFKGFGLQFNQPLDRYTSFRVGGPAEMLARPRTMDELVSMVKAAAQAKVAVTVFGGGSNTLVSDEGIQGLVLILSRLKSKPELIDPVPEAREEQSPKRFVTAFAGERLSTLCKFAMDNGLSGLEWAAGIPGTLGGALMMNAGSFGSDMGSLLESLEILDLNTLTCQTMGIKNLNFKYRNLELKEAIVLKAVIALTPADPNQIKEGHEKKP